MLAEWSAERAEGGLTELIPACYYRLVLVPVLVDYRVLGNVNIEYVNLTRYKSTVRVQLRKITLVFVQVLRVLQ